MALITDCEDGAFQGARVRVGVDFVDGQANLIVSSFLRTLNRCATISSKTGFTLALDILIVLRTRKIWKIESLCSESSRVEDSPFLLRFPLYQEHLEY